MIINRLSNYMEMIKIEHTLFALPFAITSAIIAAKGLPDAHSILWITTAVLGARTAAMSLNRLIDADIDAKNPRTANRHIPSGKVRKAEAAGLAITGFAVMALSAYKLNMLAFKLSPIAIVLLSVYPFTKRFTSICHIILGAAVSLAPLGAWIAVKGCVNATAILITLAVATWVTGFDIIYALQDIEFDRRYGLFSLPAKFGTNISLAAAKLFHTATLMLLIMVGIRANLGLPYFAGISVSSMLMAREHTLIAKDFTKINYAFFNLNGYISLTVMIFTIINYTVRLH